MRHLILLLLLVGLDVGAQPTTERAQPPIRILSVEDLDDMGEPFGVPTVTLEGDRSLADAAVIVGTATAPLLASEILSGISHAVRNQLRWCIDAQGYGADDCLALNRDVHALEAGARVLLVGSLASLALTTVASDLEAGEAMWVTGSAVILAKVGFDVAVNLTNGRPIWYEGSVAASDRLANRIGQVPVFIGTVAVTAAILAATLIIVLG